MQNWTSTLNSIQRGLTSLLLISPKVPDDSRVWEIRLSMERTGIYAIRRGLLASWLLPSANPLHTLSTETRRPRWWSVPRSGRLVTTASIQDSRWDIGVLTGRKATILTKKCKFGDGTMWSLSLRWSFNLSVTLKVFIIARMIMHCLSTLEGQWLFRLFGLH